MATDGFFKLGEAIMGGGIDRQGAYFEGLEQGTNINYRRAQTENALAQARLRQKEAVAIEDLGDAIEAAGGDRRLAPILAGKRGADFKAMMGGLETGQSMDFRDVLADPNADIAARQGAGLALREKPVTAGDMFGPGGGELAVDVFAGPQPGSERVTQTGTAQIGADEALAAERLAGAALDDAKRLNPEKFRSGGVSINLGPDGQGLGDVLVDQALSIPTTMPEEGDVAAAAGMSGALGAGANVIGDVLEIGIPFPNLERARNAMQDLALRTQIVGQQGIPGRPSNYLMQQLARLGVEPGTLTRGDEGSLQRLEQTSRFFGGEIERLRQMVNMGEAGGLTGGDLSDATTALRDLATLKRDYDVVIDKLARSLAGPTNVAAGGQPDAEGWMTTPSGTRFRVKQEQ